jgi:hypothetical protein
VKSHVARGHAAWEYCGSGMIINNVATRKQILAAQDNFIVALTRC